MWFKGLRFFQVSSSFSTSLDEMASKLQNNLIRECSSSDQFTFGWVPLISGADFLSLKVDNALLLRAAKEERVVDKTVLQQTLTKKILEIENRESRKVGRKEKADFKDEILRTMKATAPCKQTYIYCYLDLKARLFVVNGGNASMVESLFKLCQTTCGSFPIVPLAAQSSPSLVLTDWLSKNYLPSSLESGSKVVLKDSSEGSPSIEFKNFEPLSDTVTRHIEEGLTVKKLDLIYSDKLRLTLNDDLVVSSLKFDESLKEMAFNDSQGGAASDLDASFMIMIGAIRELFSSMCSWFEVNTDI